MHAIAVVRVRCAFALLAAVLPAWNALHATPDSLYMRMGGEPVVHAVVSETLDRVVADHRLNQSFARIDVERVKRLLVQQICALAGGGCRYTGDPMREVHAGHQISESEFYGLVEIMRDSMRRHHVGLRERNQLLALLAPMQHDIVNVPALKATSAEP